MKQIALVFSHNDREMINSFLRCTVVWSDKNNGLGSVRFTVIVAPALALVLEGKYPGVGVTPINAFQQNRFTDVINCSNLLLGVDPAKHQAVVNKKFRDAVTPERYNLEHGLIFESVFNACDGYGSSAQNIAVELAQRKIGFSFLPCTSVGDAMRIAAPEVVNNLNRFKLGGHYLQYSVPVLTRSAQVHINTQASTSIFTMFESTQIPARWPDVINRFDRLLVPSTFCRDVFVGCGVTVPTYLVPLGIIPGNWPICYKRASRKESFKFLLFANSHWENTRKNYSLAVHLFKQLFGNRKDVQLVLKLTTGTIPPKGLPSNVNVIVDRYTHAELVQLLHNCDCLLFPSNGEGFGLPPREAAATGMPVIYTDWGGLADLAKLNVGYAIPPNGQQTAVYPDGYVQGANNGSPYVGHFAQQDREALAAKMKWIVKNKDKALAKGLEDALIVRTQETYKQTVDKLLSAIGVS